MNYLLAIYDDGNFCIDKPSGDMHVIGFQTATRKALFKTRRDLKTAINIHVNSLSGGRALASFYGCSDALIKFLNLPETIEVEST